MAIKREEKDERVKMGGGRGGGVKGPKGDSCVAAEGRRGRSGRMDELLRVTGGVVIHASQYIVESK